MRTTNKMFKHSNKMSCLLCNVTLHMYYTCTLPRGNIQKVTFRPQLRLNWQRSNTFVLFWMLTVGNVLTVRVKKNVMADGNRIRTQRGQESNRSGASSDPCHLEATQQDAGCCAAGGRRKPGGIILFKESCD